MNVIRIECCCLSIPGAQFVEGGEEFSGNTIGISLL